MGKLAILLLTLLVHDDGRYANSPLHEWINKLTDGYGTLCCSVADGVALPGVDWDTKNGHYRVRLCIIPQTTPERWAACGIKDWFVVPDEALVKEPNRMPDGQAIVWPESGAGGNTRVRCFLAGAQS